MARPPCSLEQLHQPLVDLAGQHHFHHVHGLPVGVAQAAHKFGLLTDLFQHGVDFRPAAVNQHHIHPHGGQQHNILHHGGFQLVAYHGVAAVFDDHGLARVLLDIRQGLGQHPGSLRGGNVHVSSASLSW